MKKYNVYGIGNALVDVEFEVTDKFLDKHDISKGVMTLVDQELQFKLIDDINHAEAVQKPGGSAANTLYAINQFGGSAFYSCKVAADAFGDSYLKNMDEVGINTNFDRQEREKGITGKCLVMVTDDAERTLNTYLGISAELSTQEVDEQAIQHSEYVYIEGYLAASEKGHEAMKLTKSMAQKHNTKTALTLSDPSIVEAFKGRFKELIGDSIDLLFCNAEEAKIYTGKEDLAEARDTLKNLAQKIVITEGKHGSMVYDGSSFIDVSPHEVQAVDTNGAGDMYAGAFLYGITNGLSDHEAAKLASLAGSKVVSQFGPRLNGNKAREILDTLQVKI
ncbi:adenosine kinase [Fodinibius salsisoli]|uniref:Adenosine kinase n=1 Tax=Fodinibius salsisoli TaxID=2820877 RepID=A0ABT3PP13_9BACT|nr:adenosine kinase [Fodinibius salsisoli]MCW9707597.1 adenosine kinase [Fodinibius salsisoli]